MITFPISKSARQFGYIIWPPSFNKDFEKELKNAEKVTIVFNGLNIGEKRIDWKYRRISIGYKFTRALPEQVKNFEIEILPNNIIKVRCIWIQEK